MRKFWEKKQAQASKSPLPADSHRLHLILLVIRIISLVLSTSEAH